MFLTSAFIEILSARRLGPTVLLGIFIFQMTLGGCRVTVWAVHWSIDLLNHVQVGTTACTPVLTLALRVLAGTRLTTLLGGSGFLAVYVAGVVWGTVRLIHKRSLLRGFTTALPG